MSVSLDSYLMYETSHISHHILICLLPQMKIIPPSRAPLFTFIYFLYYFPAFGLLELFLLDVTSYVRLENTNFVFSMGIVGWEWREETHLKKVKWPCYYRTLKEFDVPDDLWESIMVTSIPQTYLTMEPLLSKYLLVLLRSQFGKPWSLKSILLFLHKYFLNKWTNIATTGQTSKRRGVEDRFHNPSLVILRWLLCQNLQRCAWWGVR